MTEIILEEAAWRLDDTPRGRAYIDADWVWGRSRVRALVADEDDAAARALTGIVLAAAAAVGSRPAGRTEVEGHGAIAAQLRRLLRTSPASGPPDAIVETTGGAHAVAGALGRVNDLGVVIVTAPVEPLAMSLYPDVHVRGLELAFVVAANPAGDLDAALGAPTPVGPSESLTGREGWLRLG